MIPQQRQQIIDKIDQFKGIDIPKLIAEAYPSEKDYSNIRIGEFTADEFYRYAKRAMNQLESELNSDDWLVLPVTFYEQNDLVNGSFNVADEISSLTTYIQNKNFAQAITHLRRVINYQVQQGFWNKSKVKYHTVEQKALDSLHRKLESISSFLEENIKNNSALQLQVEAEKDKLVNFYNAKTSEFQNLTNQLASATQSTNQIQELLTQSTNLKANIDSIHQTQQAKLDETKKQYEEEKKLYEAFKAELNELKKDFGAEIKESQKKNEAFLALLNKVTEDSKTFQDQLKVLNELIGKEGAVQLFRTFKERKDELNTPIKHWRWTVIIVAIVAVIFIIGTFTNLFGLLGPVPTDIDWRYLVINSLKTVPVFILLYFTIKQYTKERAFQEEYAFRSAIALTIQAYSDIAGKNKEQLIYDGP